MRTGAITALALLGLFIAGSAFLASPASAPATSSVPVQDVQKAGVSEQRLQLSDGRVVTCLTFPSHGISCDWSFTTLSR